MTTKQNARPSNLAVFPNGVIQIGRPFENILEPYSKQDIPDYLAGVDHSLTIEKKKDYEKALLKEEAELNRLTGLLKEQKKMLIVALQGRDGAGKTGAMKRIESAMDYDFRTFLSVPVGAPTDEEQQHPDFWRFFRHNYMPAYGQVRVFDRSWAEQVLVRKVMKYDSKEQVRKAYSDIRAFEYLLNSQGAVLVKIWLDITHGEQGKRFDERKKNKPKKYTEADEIARANWKKYTPAANELFHRTGTDFAPWHVISSEDKRYSRVTVLQTINAQLRKALGEE